MRLVSYFGPEGLRPGIQRPDGEVVDTQSLAFSLGLPSEVVVRMDSNRRVLALSQPALAELDRAATDGRQLPARVAILPADVRLGPPVPDPQKIICVGLNYRDHAEEVGAKPPPSPMYFAKFANSLAGPSADLVPPRATSKVDYEAELAVVVGKRGRYIERQDALAHVWGAMALNDVSARDMQLANPLWTSGKAVDTFAPCGPALVSKEELGDLQALPVATRVNGELVQDGTTASMIFGVAELVSFISESMTLEPGDIIATGTPAGVGQSRKPPLFLHEGDVVEVTIGGIGQLRNTVVSADAFTLEGTSVP